MRSVPRAGWATHGFYGYDAMTFGNPQGETSGAGGWNDADTDVLPPNARRDGAGGGTPPPPTGWTARTSPTSNYIVAGAVNGLTGEVIILDTANALYKSGNGGVSWSAITPTGFGVTEAGDIVYADGVWLAVSSASTTVTPNAYTSLDGVTWNQVASNAAGNFLTVAASNGVGGWALLGTQSVQRPGNAIAFSTNNAGSFSIGAASPSKQYSSAFWDGAQFVAQGANISNQSTIQTSVDGDSWSATVISPTSETFTGTGIYKGTVEYIVGIATTNAVRFATTPAGLCAASDSTVTPLSEGIAHVFWDGARFFATDLAGNMATFGSGVWTAETLNFPAGQYVSAMVYDTVHDVVMAFGTAGAISTRAQ